MPDTSNPTLIIQRKVDLELLKSVYQNSLMSQLASAVSVLVFFLTFFSQVPHHIIISWFIIGVSINAIRIWIAKIYLKKIRTIADYKFWFRVCFISTLIGGAFWGSAAWLTGYLDGVFYKAFLAFLSAGIGASAVQGLSAIRSVCVTFITAELLPFVLFLLTTHDTTDYIFAAVTFAYLLFLITVCFNQHQLIANALMLRFANSELVENLSLAKAEVEKANQDLKVAADQLRLITDGLPTLVAYIDINQRFLFNNLVFEDWFGLAKEKITGRLVEEVIDKEAYELFEKNFRLALADKKVTYEGPLQYREKELRHVTVTLIPHVVEERIQGFFCAINDITYRRKQEEELEHIAKHDFLTSLPNRSSFSDNLIRAIASADRHNKMCAVLFVDLDRFKNVNDTLGHQVGDKLLIEVAERLKSCLRRSDLIARMGGDEFTILLEDIDNAAQAGSIAAKICSRVGRTYVIEHHEIFVTASVGISLYPQDGKDSHQLLRYSDMAMYAAKDQGKNQYRFYAEELSSTAAKKLSLENELHRAIENKELEVVYQPLVDLNFGEIVGVEALLRWHRGDGTIVMPTEFIAIAEETNLIIKISEWVLETACAQNKTWQQAGLPAIFVSINLASRQFRESNLVRTIKSVLDTTELSANYVQLEITESFLMHDLQYAARILSNLREMGIKIALDDFGTGYSSLNYLRRYQIDNLKIDMSFIQGIPVDTNACAIVNAVIAMAHQLNMRVTAEGVESRTQLEYLYDSGCDLGQGFLFSQPLSAADMTVYLKENYFWSSPFTQEEANK